MIVAPALARRSLAPVCSGCQWVLTRVWMRLGAGLGEDGFDEVAGALLEAAVDQQNALRSL